jgi:uncharacterized glyoxalase superfamily protein PhnB
MSVEKLNPSVAFDGAPEKAIVLYEKALGSKAENVTRFGVCWMLSCEQRKG